MYIYLALLLACRLRRCEHKARNVCVPKYVYE